MLSCYILTLNSEKYLDSILELLKQACEDLVIVDSGSTDKTQKICEKHGARFISRPFDNFKDQRNYAIEQCRNTWVFSVDSDEIPNPALIDQLNQLKRDKFMYHGKYPDAFQITRVWFVLGKKVRAFLPITSPDYPIRLFRKDKVWYQDSSNFVHETPSGFNSLVILEKGYLVHYSIETIQQLYGKLNQYTFLAAQDMKAKNKPCTWLNIFINPLAAWVKWYIKKLGFLDGGVGLILGRYAYDYTYQKYIKYKYDLAAKK